jgi:PAS domain S-box-containing protein
MISILYVDDESTMLEIGKLFLERGGQFSVDIISSARDALVLIATKNYDAIVSDYQMPEIDGIEFLKKVRSSGKTIPFILFTGRGREEIVIQALNEGADFYLQKGGEPVSQFTELAFKLRHAVQKRWAETQLREHERRETDIINFLPDPTFVLDKSGRVIVWNRAMEEMTGVRPSEILGKNNYEHSLTIYHKRRPMLADLILDPNAVFEKENYAYTIHGGRVLMAETSFVRTDGTNIDLWAKASLLLDDKGEILGAIESIRDITEQKRAETELRAAYEQITASEEELRSQFDELGRTENLIRETEENFQLLVEAAPDAIYIVAGDSFAYVNPAMVRLMGATSEDELVNTSFYDRIHPSYFEEIHKRAMNVMNEGKPGGISESVYLKMDGTSINVESSIAPYRYHGKPAGLVILRDITQRKQAEILLRENKEKYRELIENANSIIVKWDKSGIITFANEYALDFFGYSSDEIIGRSITETIVPANESGSDKGLAHIIEDIIRRPENYVINENENITHDGRRVWIRWHNKPLFDEYGEFAGLFSIGSDITERKRIEAALMDSEAKFRGIFAAESDGIALIDQETGKIIDCNDALAIMHGYLTDELRGLPITALSAESDATRSAIAERTKFIRDRYHKRKDGSVFPVEITVNVMFFQGREILIGAIRDVTESRRSEEALQQANRSLALLTHVTRHDINNQLLALNGFLELLHEKVKDPSVEDYFTWISQVSTRISSMIQFASAYESVRKTDPVWQDIRNLAETATRQVSLGTVMVKNEIPTGAEVFADPLIVKVIYNLVDNAIRYGGKISTIRFSLSEQNGNEIIICEDDGVGISPEYKEKIFDRGFGKNTGLGLFLAREILSLTGIMIRETGETGAGARFEMAVPNGSFRFTGKQ